MIKAEFCLIAFVFAVTTGLANVVSRGEDEQQQQLIRERYEQIVLNRPRHGSTLEKLYRLHVETADLDTWLQQLNETAEAEPDNANVALLHALVLQLRGDDEQAREAFRRAIQRDPDDWYGPFALGRLEFYRRDYPASIVQISSAAEKTLEREQLLEIYKLLGKAHVLNNQPEQATEIWGKLAALSPNDPLTLEDLAELLFEEEQFAEADKYYVRLASLPDQPGYKKVIYTMRRAAIRSRQGEFSEAVRLYGEALDQVSPDSWLYRETRLQIEQLFRKRQDLIGLKAHYEKWIAEHTDDVEARMLLADVLTGLGKDEDARKALEGALQAAPSRDDVRQKLASELGANKERGRAIELLTPLVAKFPDDPTYYEQIGMLWNERTDHPEHRKEAAAWLKKIAGLDEDSASFAVRAAEAMAVAGLTEEALTLYREAIQRDPDAAEYHEYLGEYLLELDRRPEALDAFQQMVRGERRTAVGLIRLAELLSYHGFDEKALSAGAEAVSLDPKNFDAGLSFVQLLSKNRKLDEALKQLDRIEPLAPATFFADEVVNRRIRLLGKTKKLEAYYEEYKKRIDTQERPEAEDVLLLAKVTFALGKKEDALAWIQKILATQPESLRVLEIADRIYGRIAEFEKQIDVLDKLAELAPQKRSDYYTRKARVLMRMFDFENALLAARQVVEVSPGNPDAYMLLASIQRQSGGQEEAVQTLRRAVKAAPREPSVRVQLAAAYRESGMASEAIDAYWQAFDLADDVGGKLTVVKPLAELYYENGRFEQLLDRVRAMRRRTKDNLTAALVLSESFRVVDDLASARKELVAVLAARPNDPNLIRKLVGLARQEGAQEEALEYQLKLVDVQPGAANFRSLGDLYAEQDQPDEALEAWRTSHEKRLAQARDPSRQRYAWVDLLVQKEHIEEAMKELEALRQRHPDDWEPHYRLAQLEMREGDTARARELFSAVLALPSIEDVGWLDGAETNQTRQAGIVWGGRTPPELQKMSSLAQIKYQVMNASQSHRGYRSYQVPASLDDVKNAAISFLASLYESDGLSEEWEAELEKLGIADNQDRLVVAFLTDQRETLYESADRILAKDPSNHFVRVLVTSAIFNYGRQRDWEDKELERVEAHYNYFREERKEFSWHYNMQYAQFLAQTQQEDKLKTFAETLTLTEDMDVRMASSLFSIFQQAKLYDRLKETLEHLVALSENQGGPLSARQFGGWFHHLARQLIQEGEIDTGLHIYNSYLNFSFPSQRSPRARSARQRRYYNPQQDDDFPPPSFWWEGDRLGSLRQIHNMIDPSEEETQLVDLFEKRLETDTGEGKIADLLALTFMHWWSGEREAALVTLRQAESLAPNDDEMSLMVASYYLAEGNHQEALAAALKVKTRYGSVYRQVQLVLLDAALEAKNNVKAKEAALRLFAMHLSSEEYYDLSDKLSQLGLKEKASLAQKKGERASSQGQTARYYGGMYVRSNMPVKDPPSRIGKPFPLLENLGIDGVMEEGKQFLLCVWDKDQRSSRRCVTLLSEKAQWLADQGIVVQTLHASPLAETNTVKETYAPAYQVSVTDKKFTTVKRTLGIRGLPWLLLTDRDHIVQAEGFDVGDLEATVTELLNGQPAE